MMSPNDEHSFHGGETTDQTMIIPVSLLLLLICQLFIGKYG